MLLSGLPRMKVRRVSSSWAGHGTTRADVTPTGKRPSFGAAAGMKVPVSSHPTVRGDLVRREVLLRRGRCSSRAAYFLGSPASRPRPSCAAAT
jgi:hypothetical protein